MYNSLNIKLYNSILKSDFFLFNPINRSKVRVNSPVCLELSSLLFSIKQFIRILQFIKNQKASILYIVVDKPNYILFKNFLANYSKRIVLKSTFDSELQLKSKDLKMCFILEINLKSKIIINRLFKNNIFLINCLNSSFNINNFGLYKIYNDLADFKKVLFLVSIIKQVYNNNL